MLSKLFSYEPEGNVDIKLKWLMFARLLFTAFLFGSTLFAHLRFGHFETGAFFTAIYIFTGIIFLISLVYAIVARRIKHEILFTYIQIGVDSFLVTLIVFITGGFFSFFSFLYLVVIIYSSMILYLRGGLFVASLSSLQYALLIFLEYSSVLVPLGYGSGGELFSQRWYQVLYKVIITSAACYAVAFLSGLLTEQNRRAQKELRDMEVHVKRVEKMAYMGEMAAGLAHEIKNPLASLVGSIQLLKEDLFLEVDHQRLMDIVLRETDRLSTLVNNFLFFARPPTGKPEQIDLKEAIEEITDLFEKDASLGKDFTLIKELPAGSWVVMDSTHLRQVLWNLLLNAAEAIDNDGQINIQVQHRKNNEIRIKVKDNGCGIAPDVIQAIFDPFFTTKPDGTGLGLSIIHRILETYDSRLDVDTKENAGTTFSFNLKQAN